VGDGPGQFNEPVDVLQDGQNTYFVSEAMNNRIQRLDRGGAALDQWLIPPTYAFNGPHLAFGPDGSLFMTDSQGQLLYRYSPAGELLEQWRTIGPVILQGPVGIYFDPATKRLYVTDVVTHQVYVLAVEEG
jgi:DNA-binding beta-propeller fold protein YncE